jgi:dihydropyrimidinase
VARALAAGKTTPVQHGLTRPPELEAEATHRAITLAKVTAAPLYVVHLSAAQALLEIAAARDTGQNVFAETCPQYLYLSLDDLARPDFEGAKYAAARASGLAVARPAHQRPVRGVHRPLPVLLQGAEGTGPR